MMDGIHMTFLYLFIYVFKNIYWLLLNISIYRGILHSRSIKISSNA